MIKKTVADLATIEAMLDEVEEYAVRSLPAGGRSINIEIESEVPLS